MAKRSKIVVVGAGMAGLTAAHKLYKAAGAKEAFEICVVEGGQRIGGRINTTEFGGDKVEMGATWIHGICGSPIYEIAQNIKALESEKPWECMGHLFEEKLLAAETRAEGGFVVEHDIVESISSLYETLMNISQGKVEKGDFSGIQESSIGSFLKLSLQKFWDSKSEEEKLAKKIYGNWSKRMLEEAVFGVFENAERVHTGAADLFNLDYAAESEYRMFPGDEITIPQGYTTIIDALASILPVDMIQLGRKVIKIEWSKSEYCESHTSGRPVTLHFSDGSIMQADHVIVTVSLGVLKAGVLNHESGGGLFSPSLPPLKKDAILRLGYGVINKLFLQEEEEGNLCKTPFMKMAFHRSDSEFRHKNIPWWMRKTASIYPIYNNSSVLLSWFAGKEALELESLDDEAIIDGVSKTVSSFTSNSNQVCNDKMDSKDSGFLFRKVLKSKWGSDPLFLGSYSYVAVGCSGDDFDTLAQPLPRNDKDFDSPPLQLLFAGEATHRTHYSTTHGAYFSGLREANRLLQHYNFLGQRRICASLALFVTSLEGGMIHP
ncbi:putative polyamine oxidase 5 [Bienertia sinuspersici]